MNTSAPNTQQP
jgi:hypothetical protein